MTCPPRASTIARSRRGTLRTNRLIAACGIRCHSRCTAARSSAAFFGNGLVLFMCLDISDHIVSIILISGLFAGQRIAPIRVLARKSCVIQVESEMKQTHAYYNNISLEYGALIQLIR